MGRQLKQGCREGRCPGRDKNSQVLRAPKNEAIFCKNCCTQTARAGAADSPGSSGFRADCRSESECEVVRHMFEGSATRFVSKTRRVHQRDAEGVSG